MRVSGRLTPGFFVSSCLCGETPLRVLCGFAVGFSWTLNAELRALTILNAQREEPPGRLSGGGGYLSSGAGLRPARALGRAVPRCRSDWVTRRVFVYIG
jgi:hypothetical protein